MLKMLNVIAKRRVEMGILLIDILNVGDVGFIKINNL